VAARPWNTIIAGAVTAITAWVWLLAVVLFVLRWVALERPGPPLKVLFPYGELRIGVDASYPPFGVDNGREMYGIDIDIGKAIGAHLGIPVRFVNMGFDGLYDSLRVDQVDLLLSALLIDPSRMNDVRYTVPYYNAGLVLVTADPVVTGMAEMSRRALSFEFGSDADRIARLWQRRILPFETMPYETQQDALEAARIGLSSAALVDATAARLFRRDHPDWNPTLIEVSDALYAGAVRINRAETWAAINAVLEDMLESGELQAILARWL
jgi:polar amino acid transport system substrate-binding protein